MAVTATATLLGTYKSKITAQAMSSASGSTDILTVVHQLGTTPDWVTPIVRSVVTAASGGVPGVAVLSYNASQALVYCPAPNGGPANVLVDVIVEFIQSTNR